MPHRSFLRKIPGKIITPINIKLGRKIFNNSANFLDNIQGSFRWNKNRKAFNDNSISSNDEVAYLHEFGFTKPRKWFDQDIVDQVLAEYKNVITSRKHSYFGDVYGNEDSAGDDDVCRYVIKDPLKSLPSIKKLFTDDFVSFLKQYYQANFRLHSIAVWRNVYVSKETLDKIYPAEPYSKLWHIDGHPVDTMKFFLLLSDTTQKDGPLHFIDSKTTKEICNKGYKDRFNYRVSLEEIENEKHLNRLTGPIGTAAFCNVTQCLHRAGLFAKGHQRDILQFRFESADKEFSI